MKYINKFKLTTEFEAVKEQLQELEHYLVYDAEKDMICLKMPTDKSYILNYKITQYFIEMGQGIGGKLPLITRCDLFKSIKVDGVEQDLSGKARTPYEFKGETSEELEEELISLIMSESGFNEEYVLTTNDLVADKEGKIEVVWQDNIPLNSLIGCMIYNMLITSIPNNMFINKEVTNIHYIFSNCSSLTSLNLSNFNTSKVTNMYGMFSGCLNLTYLDLSNFDTSNVTDMSGMFMKCDKLSHIKCKQGFKDWCWLNQVAIDLPTTMREGGNGKWEIVD